MGAADVKQSGRKHKRAAEKEKDWKREQGQIMKKTQQNRLMRSSPHHAGAI